MYVRKLTFLSVCQDLFPHSHHSGTGLQQVPHSKLLAWVWIIVSEKWRFLPVNKGTDKSTVVKICLSLLKKCSQSWVGDTRGNKWLRLTGLHSGAMTLTRVTCVWAKLVSSQTASPCENNKMSRICMHRVSRFS